MLRTALSRHSPPRARPQIPPKSILYVPRVPFLFAILANTSTPIRVSRVLLILIALQKHPTRRLLLLRYHNLLNQLERRAQRQAHHIVIAAVDFLNEYRARSLYAVPAGLVVTIARADVCYYEFVGNCFALAQYPEIMCEGKGCTSRVKLDRRFLHMCRHPVPRICAVFIRFHDRDRCHHLVLPIVSQHLQHVNVIGLAPRLLQYPARVRDNDGVGGDDNGRVAALRVVDFPLVYILRFF